MHVNLDRGRNGIADIVVAGLARQHRMEIISLKIFQEKRIDCFVSIRVFIRTIDKSVLSPPIELRSGGT